MTQMHARREHVVGRKLYFSTASVVMACHLYNAAARPDGLADHWFYAAWTQRWFGKVLTIREVFVEGP